MKFYIKDIAPEGRKISCTLEDAQVRAFLTAGGVELVDAPTFMQLDLQLSKMDETVIVRGKIHGEYSVTCGKCLGAARIVVDEPDLILTFLPPTQMKHGDDEELSAEDLDVLLHDGEELDLEPVLREQMILALPIAPLCREDCQGICATCGAELNFEKCKCADQSNTRESSWVMHMKELKKAMSARTN